MGKEDKFEKSEFEAQIDVASASDADQIAETEDVDSEDLGAAAFATGDLVPTDESLAAIIRDHVRNTNCYTRCWYGLGSRGRIDWPVVNLQTRAEDHKIVRSSDVLPTSFLDLTLKRGGFLLELLNPKLMPAELDTVYGKGRLRTVVAYREDNLPFAMLSFVTRRASVRPEYFHVLTSAGFCCSPAASDRWFVPAYAVRPIEECGEESDADPYEIQSRAILELKGFGQFQR